MNFEIDELVCFAVVGAGLLCLGRVLWDVCHAVLCALVEREIRAEVERERRGRE